MKKGIVYVLVIVVFSKFMALSSGCANIIPPTGGPRDSLPPTLLRVTPGDSSLNFTSKRIDFYFDEFVEVQNIQENLIVSPTPTINPVVEYKLRNVSVRIRDTLEPNTTYSINFGKAIRDINEGNELKDFTYVFSTGSTLDNKQLSGNVVLAETGKVDSTMIGQYIKNGLVILPGLPVRAILNSGICLQVVSLYMHSRMKAREGTSRLHSCSRLQMIVWSPVTQQFP
jgi:hypothetical protein